MTHANSNTHPSSLGKVCMTSAMDTVYKVLPQFEIQAVYGVEKKKPTATGWCFYHALMQYGL